MFRTVPAPAVFNLLRTWKQWLGRKHVRLGELLFAFRRLVPALLALLGLAYIWFGQLALQGHSLWSSHVLLAVVLWVLVTPTLTWAILRWGGEALQELAFQRRESKALDAIRDAANQSLETDAILQKALDTMVDQLDLEAGEIRLVAGENLVLRRHHGVSSQFVHAENSIRLGHCLCGRCALNGGPLVVDALAQEPSLAGSPCANEQFQSMASLPMKAGASNGHSTPGAVTGVLHVASRRPNAFSSRKLKAFATIGDAVANVIKNAQMYEAARRQAVYMEAASLIGQRMTSLIDLDSLLEETARLIRSKFGYAYCHILLTNETNKGIAREVTSGPTSNANKQHQSDLTLNPDSVAGWVAQTGQSLMVNDLSHESRYHKLNVLEDMRAELATPLRIGKRVIGVLDVQSERQGAFNKQDMDALQILGNQLGIAIENTRLFQETGRRYNTMVALHDTTLDVLSQLNMSELLDALLRRGVKLLGAQAGAFFRYDADEDCIHEDRIQNVATYNVPQDWQGLALRPEERVIGRIILENSPLLVNDYQAWQKQASVEITVPYTAVMGAPLRWRGQVIGGIVLLDKRQPGVFDRNDLWSLQLFADLATIAIKNAELYTHSTALSHELEHKVERRTHELVAAKEEVTAKAELLQVLLSRTTRIQEAERARIARDMHDGVVQLVTAARYELQAARIASQSGMPTRTQEKLSTARDVLHEIEQEIRHVIYDLMPSALNGGGLIPALQKYIDNLQDLSGLTTNLEVTGNPCALGEAVEGALFRLVEQALHNVIIHAQATSVSVGLRFEAGRLWVTVQDDGQGFDHAKWRQKQDREHLGLLSMQERIADMGGTMEVVTAPGQGALIRLGLPIRREEAS